MAKAAATSKPRRRKKANAQNLPPDQQAEAEAQEPEHEPEEIPADSVYVPHWNGDVDAKRRMLIDVRKNFAPARKRDLFAIEYRKDRNATQAAIRAGYSERTAGQIGHHLLKNVEIREAIQKGDAEYAKNAGVDRLFVIKGLKKNFRRAMEVKELHNLNGEVIGFAYEGAVANKSLELLGKTTGDTFTPEPAANVNVGVLLLPVIEKPQPPEHFTDTTPKPQIGQPVPAAVDRLRAMLGPKGGR